MTPPPPPQHRKTKRNVVIPDALWALATEKAHREFTNVSAVINRLLYEWVREDYPEEQPAKKAAAAKKAPPKKRGKA